MKEKKVYSLMIGRYQPLHAGHIKLIQSVLDEGKNVCVAIRNTMKDESNPYNYDERLFMFIAEFKDEMLDGTVKVIKIPDIDEVCHGRKVGWGIRVISLDKETEQISATKIRESRNVETD